MAVRRGKRNLKLQVSEETPAPVYVIKLSIIKIIILSIYVIYHIIILPVLNNKINIIINIIIY